LETEDGGRTGFKYYFVVTNTIPLEEKEKAINLHT
jgi:hypothetical protein